MARMGWRMDLVLLAIVANVAAVLAITHFGAQEVVVGPEAVAEAAERTVNTDGLRFSLRGEMEVPNVGQVSFTGSGVADLRGERGVMTVDMSELAEQAGAGAALGPADLKMEMLFDRRFFYMKFPLLAAQLDGRSWMRFDLRRVSEAAGIDRALFRAQQGQGSDPANTLRYLRALSDRVEKLGDDDVRGVQATHYRATVELRKYPDLLPAAERDLARRSIERLIELSGDDEMKMEIWVGEDKMIRRVKWSQSMKAQGTDQVVAASFTSDYYDFGTKVSVEPPPEDDVRDVTEEAAAGLLGEG
jgi:hypothetical protein